jgi:hypothetical protein
LEDDEASSNVVVVVVVVVVFVVVFVGVFVVVFVDHHEDGSSIQLVNWVHQITVVDGMQCQENFAIEE